jgi:hypothetical protein
MDSHDTGSINRDTVMALFVILNHDFPSIRTLSGDDTKLLFAILDRDGSDSITEEEFMEFGQVLLLEFVKTSDYATFVEVNFPNIFRADWYQKLCKIVRSNGFEQTIDLILVLNAVVIVFQSYPELAGQTVDLEMKYWDGALDTPWEIAEAVFTAIYLFECFLKLMVLGRKTYFEAPKNVFDFTITICAVLSTGIVYYPNEISNSRLIRMIVMARVMVGSTCDALFLMSPFSSRTLFAALDSALNFNEKVSTYWCNLGGDSTQGDTGKKERAHHYISLTLSERRPTDAVTPPNRSF